MTIDLRDSLGIKGRFQLWARDKDGNLVAEIDEWNVILDVGLVALIASMVFPSPSPRRTFYAIVIGDNGALATDPMVPKVIDPVVTTTMFHEIGARAGGVGNITTAAVAGVASGINNAIQLQQTFTAGAYVDGDFLDATKKYLNEAAVFLGDAVDAPAAWEIFSMRTFKSIPFGPADAVTALIRWTFELQRGTV